MTRHLGLDLGGSAIKAIVLEAVGDSYREIHKTVVPTENEAAPPRIVEQLGEVGADVAAGVGGVDTAGITIPGTFDLDSGIGRFVTNLGGAAWASVPVREPVHRRLGVPTALINDARAFGFAEWRLGAARGCDTAGFFTLGTGIGGAVVVGGRLHLGRGSAGELGHMTVDASADAPLCGCGNPGCVEAHVQAGAIARAAGRDTAEEAVEAARGGDARAVDALAQAGRWLGVAISTVAIAINPERIVIGGGVAEAGDLIFEAARAEVKRRVLVPPADRMEIVPAQLGYEAGSIGAALWGAEHA
jgi:glucokinase